MSTRLLLEGEDLPALMARIRAEMGPGARIVKAEKVRTGGVAGFFAREHYELTIEVPDVRPDPLRRVPRRPRSGETTSGPVGLDALLAAAEEAEQRAAEDDPGQQEDVGTGAAAAPSAPSKPSMSTSTPMFAEILASMQQVVGPPEQIEAGPSADGTAEGGPPGTGTDGEHVSSTGAEVVDEVPEDAVPVEATPVEPAPRPGGGSSAAALVELGVPARLLAGVADLMAPMPLSVLVRRFDKPPSVRLLPGSVVAVVGPADLALRTATQMAQRADVEPHEVVLAGAVPSVPGHGRRLQTPGALARLRSRVAEDVPTIVAVGVGEAREDWDVAAELVDALTPHQSWAAVDARRKSVDLRRWLRVVGKHRPFDALAVSGTFEAQAPGTVLGLGVPVGWVDGLPATPVVWAAVLSERMADDARWD